MRMLSSGVRVLAAFVLLVTAMAFAPAPAAAQSGERCFSETGYCISGAIRTFWESNGGLAVFGLPLGPQQPLAVEGGPAIQVQWFERHRLELHPENPAPYNVLLGRLGVDRLTQQGRDWRAFPPFDPNQADAERCAFFRETNRQVCDEFLQAFRSFGLSFANTPGVSFAESLALFGLPVSDPMTETIEGKELTVQWFERARFELHPDNQPPYRVLFGRLGAELGGGATTDDAGAALGGREWRLVSYGPANSQTPAATEAPSTLTFDQGNLAGNSGCNSFGGAYEAAGSSITVGPLRTTLALCTSDELTRQERAIFAVLQGAVPFSVEGTRLRLGPADGQSLTYEAGAPTGAAALEGRQWRLVAFGSTTNPTNAVTTGQLSTISFDGERVAGNTGCNGFGGGYSASDSTITFDPLISTLIACLDEGLQAQERAILGALQGAVPFSIAGDRLFLSYDGGRQTLTYEAAPAPRLEGRAWRLVTHGPTDAPVAVGGERPATLNFDGQRVSGTTGCNNLSGAYTATATTISFGPLAVTRALCTEPALQAQETAVLAALQGEVPFSIDGDRLTITYDGGRQTLLYQAPVN